MNQYSLVFNNQIYFSSYKVHCSLNGTLLIQPLYIIAIRVGCSQKFCILLQKQEKYKINSKYKLYQVETSHALDMDTQPPVRVSSNHLTISCQTLKLLQIDFVICYPLDNTTQRQRTYENGMCYIIHPLQTFYNMLDLKYCWFILFILGRNDMPVLQVKWSSHKTVFSI